MAYCTKCGKKLKDGDKFCFNCGEPVRGAAGDVKRNVRSRTDRGRKLSSVQLAGGIAAALAVIFALSFLLRGGKDSDVKVKEDGNQYTSDFGDTDSLKSGSETGDEAEEDRSGTAGKADAAGMAADVIKNIENQSGYVSDSSWKPLAATDDFNGDNVQELLAVYEVKEGAGINVMYDLWSLKDTGAEKLRSEVLFKEVGGNNGIVGIVKPGGVPYLAVYRYEPEGELFNEYYTYFSWERDKSALGDSGYYLECHGNYTQEENGRYILGDTDVEKSEFDAKYEELTQWTYKLDLLEGAEEGVKTFDELL